MGEGVPELNAQDNLGQTKLHYAVIKGDYADIITILQYIPDKDIQDVDRPDAFAFGRPFQQK